MIEYAYVIKRDKDYVIFYNGNGFGASGTGVAVAHPNKNKKEDQSKRI